MSARIGDIKGNRDLTVGGVSASLGGVEVTCGPPKFTLDPMEARNAAAVLVRAADEVERMRTRAAGARYETDFKIDIEKYPAVGRAMTGDLVMRQQMRDLLCDARADAVQYIQDVKAHELREAFERGKREGRECK